MKARKLLSSDQLNKVIAMEGSPLVCDDCGKSFTDDVKLGLHHYAVHSEKPFVLSAIRALVQKEP